MTTAIKIDLEGLNTMVSAMNKVGDQTMKLDGYVATQVCSTAGMGGHSALAPIAAALKHVSGAFDGATDEFQQRWGGFTDAAVASARHLYDQDDAVADALTTYRGKYQADVCYVPAAGGGAAKLEDLPLRDAENGEAKLDHPALFETAAATWDEVRDKINDIIDFAAKAKIHLPKLPDVSLRDLIVYPLSGDYRKIRANADACKVLDGAMGQWAGNIGRTAVLSKSAVTGTAGHAMRAHFALYGVTVKGLGDVVGRASAVFEGIAAMSEKIAVRIEIVMGKLATKLKKLLGIAMKRIQPAVAAFNALKDTLKGHPERVVTELWDAVNEIKDVKQTIDDALALADKVRAWAQERADALKKFDRVLSVVSSLPEVRNVGLGGVHRPVSDVARKLDEITFKGDTGKEARDLVRDVAGLQATDRTAQPLEPCRPVQPARVTAEPIR